ncbi:dTDP-4-dehydrorhamnose 3,5-epimerase [Candidatus Pelagibacter sp.]|nr:dTDP-4-dehydrorhamnose 3,5-epimerase [Candidatus Pelagibacter sp.]|tara:strand:- start:361 stop:888 length:528 start_codon:yes stop_codon:yes gene_type:complete
MKIIKTNFKDLKIYQKQSFKDQRGYTRELFNNKLINKKFPFDLISLSKKNVIRGLHLQIRKPQAKFITVLRGKIFDVVVDCRRKSKTFGKYFSIILSEKKNISLYIPDGFAHGYCSLSDNSLIHYKMTNYRYSKLEKGILWNDNIIKIKWPIKKPIISIKDKNNMSFNEYINTYE